MNNISKRVSVRQYLEKEVEEEKIQQLLQAAMQSPSAGNQQPWHFYVVTNKEIKDQLAACQKYASPCSRAPLVIVPCMKQDGIFPEFAIQDISASIENILLEAVDLDLGGVWMGVYPRENVVNNVRNVLSIPDTLTPTCLLAIGYPAKEGNTTHRYSEDKITFIR